MEIVVRGRHIEVSDRFREHVSQKLVKIERYDGKCHRVDVEFRRSRTRGWPIRLYASRSPATARVRSIRAEAAADEKYAALDVAYGRLVERMRRAADRRHDHQRSQGRALAERYARRRGHGRPCTASDGVDDFRRCRSTTGRSSSARRRTARLR